jgi:hypothetical protein
MVSNPDPERLFRNRIRPDKKSSGSDRIRIPIKNTEDKAKDKEREKEKEKEKETVTEKTQG